MRAAVGGKGFNLAELSKVEGIRVPEGFCVTIEAYKRAVGQNERCGTLLDQLSTLKLDDKGRIRDISGKVRTVIAGMEIPADIEQAISRQLSALGGETAYAVRSSATAEDLPLASFAGQQDSYLNIKGKAAVLRHVCKCWASLFTERAVIYRLQHGFGHRNVHMSVVIQRMVFPQSAGILFTADPVTSNRKVVSIDAAFGLGEALVSGLVNPDTYKVRDGRIVDRQIAIKDRAVHPSEAGGTRLREIEPARRNRRVLSDQQILQLDRMGRRIEAHFGCPQDVEWCMTARQPADSRRPASGRGATSNSSFVFHIVQSRPITTLFPLPENDGHLRVYASVGHAQMMTDAMKPLGLSIFALLYQGRPFHRAAGRLFLELTPNLASPAGRRMLLRAIGANDPIMRNAIRRLTRRKKFMDSLRRGQGESGTGVIQRPAGRRAGVASVAPALIQELMARSEASISDLRQRLAKAAGDEVFALILQDQAELKALLFDPRSFAVLNAATSALHWLNQHLEKWLGEKGVADPLSLSVPGDVTSEMGLALLDVADVVRQYPAVIEYLQHANDETFFDDLAKLPGGDAVGRSLRGYLEQYGMRCSGEIDVTRTRWSEQPTALVPALLSNVRNCAPNAREVRFEQGRLQAEQAELELLSRLEQLPGGERKAKETKRMIRILRASIGYREFPKYAWIRRYWIYRQALLRQADMLVQRGVIREQDDVYYLSLEEFREAARTSTLDHSVVAQRREEHAVYERLMPPRLMTSEGEVISGESRDDSLPRDALAGTPVSAGVVEGRARVLFKLEDAVIEHGDILVTTFTDPSWTPLFTAAKGLVTEVGGPMTHGAVIAREYGLPAVVSVENATRRIKDGQMIRVNGTAGYVEVVGAGEP